MWCVFHNAQWYWSDNVCKLVTDQWRASLGVRDNESCWFTEEIGTYMRCWESPGDLPLVIEIVVSFCSFCCAPLAKRHKISITRGRSPGLSQKVCKNLLVLIIIRWLMFILHLIPLISSNQYLSPLKLWVRTPFIVRCTRYNIMW
jgi:hypothetical protein